MVGIVKRQVQVLERLCEPETLHIIILGRGHVVDVVGASIRNRCREVLLEALHRTDSIVEIFRVARRAPSIKVGLEYFGT